MSKIEILSGNELYPIKRTIDAVVVGAWAFHESQNGEGWTVTDMKSGRACPASIADGMTMTEAEAIARHLDERLGVAPDVIRTCGIDFDGWPYTFEALLAEALDTLESA